MRHLQNIWHDWLGQSCWQWTEQKPSLSLPGLSSCECIVLTNHPRAQFSRRGLQAYCFVSAVFFSAEPWIQPLGLPPKQPSKNGATPPRLPNMLQLPFRFWSYDFVVFWSERLWIVIGCICISQVFAAFNPFVSSIIARFLCFIQISNLSSQPWNFTIPTHHAVKIHHVHPSNNSRPKKI